MKKWEYDILIKAEWGYDVDYETKRLAWLIMDREKKLLKEQLSALYAKEKALKQELDKIESGIWKLEHKQDKIYHYRTNIDPIIEKKVG